MLLATTTPSHTRGRRSHRFAGFLEDQHRAALPDGEREERDRRRERVRALGVTEADHRDQVVEHGGEQRQGREPGAGHSPRDPPDASERALTPQEPELQDGEPDEGVVQDADPSDVEPVPHRVDGCRSRRERHEHTHAVPLMRRQQRRGRRDRQQVDGQEPDRERHLLARRFAPSRTGVPRGRRASAGRSRRRRTRGRVRATWPNAHAARSRTTRRAGSPNAMSPRW